MTYTPFIILLVTVLGFGLYIRIAQKRKSTRIEDFFVAGRNIGTPLFTQTTWGSSFAFGNSIFYAIWLGYSMGLSALWVQALWALGMSAYAMLLPRLIGYTEHFTLHGFLGSTYGSACRVISSLVSMIGLMICLGFEISFAGQYFSQVTGIENMEWLIVLGMAVFAATFSSIGGFKANTATDRITNGLCVGALCLVLLALVTNYHLLDTVTSAGVMSSLTDFSSTSSTFLVGLAFFSLFNIVDMSNWQNVSANSLNIDSTPESLTQRRKMRGAMFKAAGLFLLAPVILGTLIGYGLKLATLGTMDQAHFMSNIIASVFPVGSILIALLLGFVTFAFMAACLSGSDSWLLAVTQTLSWDLIDHKKLKAVNFRPKELGDAENARVTRRASLAILVVGVAGTGMIYYVSKYIWDQVFALQFVIFGGALAMLPSLLYGIFKGNPSRSGWIAGGAVCSIVGGYGTALFLFGKSVLAANPSLVEPVPMYALGVSLAIFLVGLLGFALSRLGARPSQTDFSS
jgi:Na+/proline symporter